MSKLLPGAQHIRIAGDATCNTEQAGKVCVKTTSNAGQCVCSKTAQHYCKRNTSVHVPPLTLTVLYKTAILMHFRRP